MKKLAGKLLKKWKKLLKVEDEHPMTAGSVPSPMNDGLKRKHCSCGGIIISSGQFVIRELCSSCGKPYHEPIYRRR